MKWYCVSRVLRWSSDKGTSYDVHIVYSSQDFMEVFKLYMKKYLFSKYYIRETGVHPESVPPETLFNTLTFGYAFINEHVCWSRDIPRCMKGVDQTTADLISNVEKSLRVYMNKFITHIYSTKRSCCFGCDSDWYLTRKHRHSYDFDTNKFTTSKKVSSSDGSKLVPYVF